MEKDRRYLATSDQPFALGGLNKGLASFRKRCMDHQYSVDEEAKEEELGPPGRAFRNGHPEISPDLRLYSTKEFPLRNDAAHFALRSYVALPLYDLYSRGHGCFGVLELVGHGASTQALNGLLEAIFHSLQEANLSPNHINFQPGFQIAESREVALTEIRDALHLINKIPQLYMTEVWVPYSKCASLNSDISCMELVARDLRYVPELPLCKITHEPTNEGIAGMVLASEDKSCYCRNSCDFGIGEQHLAHYVQRKRLDVCFAICLKSSHTGNLLYLLEFFLHQGPATCEYLRSFLNFLLPIMKRKLTSFKVASGKQLGEELVVEVVQFSEVNKLTFSKPHQQDMFPVKFKFVQHGKKEYQHANDQEMQYVPHGVDFVTNGAQAKDCSTAADNSKEKEHQHANDQEMQYVSEGNYSVTSGAQTRECSSAVENSRKTKKRKGKTASRLVTLEDLEPLFGKTLEEAKAELRVARSTIKRVLRDNGILRWPNTENQKKNLSLSMKGSASCEIAQDSQQNIRPSSSGNPPLQQNVPQTNTESTQYIAVQAEAQKVIVEVTYEGDTIKFQLYLSSGIEKLVEEVVRRLNLKKGSFKLKYVDEDEKQILLACDDDLELCPRSVTATGKTCIQLLCYPK